MLYSSEDSTCVTVWVILSRKNEKNSWAGSSDRLAVCGLCGSERGSRWNCRGKSSENRITSEMSQITRPSCLLAYDVAIRYSPVSCRKHQQRKRADKIWLRRNHPNYCANWSKVQQKLRAVINVFMPSKACLINYFINSERQIINAFVKNSNHCLLEKTILIRLHFSFLWSGSDLSSEFLFGV